MIGFRAIRQTFAWMTCAATLASCTSGGDSFLERVLPLAVDQVLGAEQPEAQPLPSRERLNQIPFATIAVSNAADAPPSFVVAVAINNGYATYQEQSRRSIVMFGGLLTSTNGLGYDLAATKHQNDDPIAVQTPLQSWPEVIRRNYQFTLSSRPNYEITVVCVLQPIVRERIEIFEIEFDVTRVQERCNNPRRKFTNTYWVADDGFIWQSEQWAGPRVEPFSIKIVRPLVIS